MPSSLWDLSWPLHTTYRPHCLPWLIFLHYTTITWNVVMFTHLLFLCLSFFLLEYNFYEDRGYVCSTYCWIDPHGLEQLQGFGNYLLNEWMSDGWLQTFPPTQLLYTLQHLAVMHLNLFLLPPPERNAMPSKRTERWLPEAGWRGKWEGDVQSFTYARWVSSGDLTYSAVSIVNTAALHIEMC